MRTYDDWKATNPDDQWLGNEYDDMDEPRLDLHARLLLSDIRETCARIANDLQYVKERTEELAAHLESNLS